MLCVLQRVSVRSYGSSLLFHCSPLTAARPMPGSGSIPLLEVWCWAQGQPGAGALGLSLAATAHGQKLLGSSRVLC